MSERIGPAVTKPSIKRVLDWSSELTDLMALQRRRKERSPIHEGLDIKVKSNGLPYFFVMPLSDLHIGAEGVDYYSLKHHMDILKNFPIYTFLLGDMGDFFGPKILADAMSGDLETPDEQASTIRAFFKEYEEKILGVVPGNHDNFVKKASGVGLWKYALEGLNIPLIESGSTVNLNVDGQKYKIKPFHQIAKYNSSFNLTHAGKQALRLGDDEADVVMSGDKHVGAVEQTGYRDRVVTILQTGTFKTHDAWGKEEGFISTPTPFFPVLAFDARRHNVEVVRDVDAATEFIDLMGGFQKKKAVAGLHFARKGKK